MDIKSKLTCPFTWVISIFCNYQQQDYTDSCIWNDRCVRRAAAAQPIQCNVRLTAAAANCSHSQWLHVVRDRGPWLAVCLHPVTITADNHWLCKQSWIDAATFSLSLHCIGWAATVLCTHLSCQTQDSADSTGNPRVCQLPVWINPNFF